MTSRAHRSNHRKHSRAGAVQLTRNRSSGATSRVSVNVMASAEKPGYSDAQYSSVFDAKVNFDATDFAAQRFPFSL